MNNKLKQNTAHLLALLFMFGSSKSYAAICLSLKSTKDLVECALVNHPAIARNRAQVEQTEAGKEKASQFVNPEMDGKWLVGQSMGDINTSAEISLLHTFELGGKRSARMDLASAQTLSSQADRTKARELVFSDTVKNLYRARQIKDELRTIDEIISTFRQVLGQYRKRPKLSPEQQISSSVLALAESDFLIKQSQLNAEWTQTVKSLELATSNNFGSDFTLLPTRKTDWPKVLSVESNAPIKGAEVEAVEAAKEISRNEYELAKAESYPDLKIGPTATFENQGGVSSASIGVSFSFPLQILSLNGGGRAVALKSMAATEVEHSLKNTELRSELDALVKKYSRTVAVLSSQPTPKAVDRMHREAEENFNRGIVSSALLLEAHRQLFELLKDQNQYELEAFETLIRIKVLKGEPLEALL